MCFAAPAVYVPVHLVMSAPLVAGVNCRVTLVIPEPRFWVVEVMTPAATVTPPLTYCVDSVEQPDADVLVGKLPCDDAYSATEVLHAASAASVMSFR